MDTNNAVKNVSDLVHDVIMCAEMCHTKWNDIFPTNQFDLTQLDSEMNTLKFDAESVQRGAKKYNNINFQWYLVHGLNSNLCINNRIIITSDYKIHNKLLDIAYNINNKELTLELHLDGSNNSKSNEVIKSIDCKDSGPNQAKITEIAKSFWSYFYDSKAISSDLTQNISTKLLASKNIILHGAPGTGKTYLSKAVAANLIGTDLERLNSSEQFAFVQFHPSYDYTDFVEGLRPLLGKDSELKLILQPGIFEKFAKKASEHLNKKYVFIIDEINRGEISKILGELFFALDPGYRGIKGAVKTQYDNLHNTDDLKNVDTSAFMNPFYIPSNLYLIGTMNDIDRSVDNFDFATRRRFRFIKIKPTDSISMLNSLKSDEIEKAKQKLLSLNDQITKIDNLSEDYQIGPSYFLNLADLDYNYETLWSDYLEPLLRDYLYGDELEDEDLKKLKEAYDKNY